MKSGFSVLRAAAAAVWLWWRLGVAAAFSIQSSVVTSSVGSSSSFFFDTVTTTTTTTRRITQLTRRARSTRHGNSVSQAGISGRMATHLQATTAAGASVASNKQHRDVVVVGGGLAGLSAALYLTQLDPSRHVTILDREPGPLSSSKSSTKKTTVASLAAAGMLAPQSERLPQGPLLDLCLESRRMYLDFVELVETLARQSGDEGAPYLASNNNQDNEDDSCLHPWQIGYVGAGGFLAPAFAGDAVATWAPPVDDESGGGGAHYWLDATQARELEPHLHPDVVGGWWFPEDASVDARRLTHSLRAACVAAGVQFLHGPAHDVTSLDLVNGTCRGLFCQGGNYLVAKQVLIANGAWMRQLLPVPIEPHKGQSLSLRLPETSAPLLRRVLFAQDCYIVPKADGKRLVVGATVEAGSFDAHITPAGLMHVLHHALQLVPALAELPIEETWVGLRPTTPDKGPILGVTPWNNIFLAGGYWRNGVLLAPKTGQLIARLLIEKNGRPESSTASLLLSTSDRALLKAFAWDRFTSQDSSQRGITNANARYAAALHPIHRRKSGVGVAASVGTELGSYSTARSAAEERKLDRQLLFSPNDTVVGAAGTTTTLEDRLEQAAALGKSDAAAYTIHMDSSVGDDQQTTTGSKAPSFEQPTAEQSETLWDFPSSSNESEESVSNLDDVYESIRANKAQQQQDVNTRKDDDDEEEEKRPDPGFRIYHVDKNTGEQTMVPPYTSPGDFMALLQDQSKEERDTRTATTSKGVATKVPAPTTEAAADSDDDSAEPSDSVSETTVDASQSISSDDDDSSNNDKSDLEDVYESIRANKKKQQKAQTWASMLEDDNDKSEKDSRPDPGFRIYHVDKETGEQRVVPPYTTPGDFMKWLEQEKAKAKHPNMNQPQPKTTKETETPIDASEGGPKSKEAYNEQTFDGYTVIQQANSRASRKEELQAMREARRRNRKEETQVREIGVVDWAGAGAGGEEQINNRYTPPL